MQNEQSNQEQGKGRGGGNTGINLVGAVVEAMAFTMALFLHRKFGSRYIGRNAAMGILVILVFAAVMPMPGAWTMILFLVAYFKAWIYARAGVLYRRFKRQENEHTRYSGWPYLMTVLPGWTELTVKRFIEPLLVVVVGVVLWFFVPGLGLYLVMAGVSLFISVELAEAYDRRRAEMMHDAVIEATQRAERFRTMSSGRR